MIPKGTVNLWPGLTWAFPRKRTSKVKPFFCLHERIGRATFCCWDLMMQDKSSDGRADRTALAHQVSPACSCGRQGFLTGEAANVPPYTYIE
eukprot:1158431-Pelagomonas_calceolata.AAC.8